MNEHERIAWIMEELRSSPEGGMGQGGDAAGETALVGNGDDAAILGPLAMPTISVDAQVEGVHFQSDFADWETLGARAAVVALSDLAAMGAQPRALFASLSLPADFGDDDFKALMRGIWRSATDCGASLAGGNLSRADSVAMHCTVVGEAGKSRHDQGASTPMTRAGAKPGDAIWLGGFPGAAALGLAALLKGRGDEPIFEAFTAAWRRPKANFALGETLAGKATAAIDISDGLLSDLGHLCKASRLDAALSLEDIPRMPGFERAAEVLGLDARALILTGGEVYDLLFAAPANLVFDGATRIGSLGGQQQGAPRILVDGHEAPSAGFDHFE